MPEIERTDEEWRALLSPEQYQVLRQAGTERPWSGNYVDEHADGTYHCAACGAALFDAATKYESGSGWPSFSRAKEVDAVELIDDSSHGMVRTEVRCRRCGSHRLAARIGSRRRYGNRCTAPKFQRNRRAAAMTWLRSAPGDPPRSSPSHSRSPAPDIAPPHLRGS